MIQTIRYYITPERIILLATISIICIGTALLALPFSQQTPIPLIDLFFTATSATCVTGLLTVPLEQFTLFGHWVILALIQIGGIGLITISLFLLSLFMNMESATHTMAHNLLNIHSHKNIKNTLGIIICVTLAIEVIGALLMFNTLTATTMHSSLFTALFHAVSSFCNAGFTLFSTPIMQHSPILVATMILTFVGSLGFTTWYEIFHYTHHAVRAKKYQFSPHSKTVLYGAAIIIASALCIFVLLERHNILKDLNFIESWTLTIFNVMSFTGSGFQVHEIAELHHHTKILAVFMSCIGTSPLSTGTGVKITSLIACAAIIKAAFLGNDFVTIRHHRIAISQTYKSIAIVLFSLFWIIFSTACLLITETHSTFHDVLFESVTAFTNLGLTAGVTPQLSAVGKVILMISIVIGRIGAIAFILTLKSPKRIHIQTK